MTMKVREVMKSNVRSIAYSATLKELLALLDEMQISGVPVVDADGRLVGVVSRTDIGKGVGDPPLANEADRDFYKSGEMDLRGLETARVGDIMTEHVVTIAPEEKVTALIDLMQESGIHRVFVTEGEEIAGVVTTMDLAGVLKKMLN